MASPEEILNGFEIAPRYENPVFVGSGAYGSVVSAIDTETRQKVAIKKLNRLEDIIDAKRNLREIRCMRTLRHENILNLSNVIHRPTQEGDVGDLYLVSPLMDTDLHRILKTAQQLTDEHAQYFLYQILRALNFLQGASIVHRDIKPSNILVNAACDIKLCDFGLSRSITDPLDDLTEYVVTRFYRAPEVMLSSHEYTNAIDMWSVGCTFGEILSRKVLFPGTNYIKQIDLIVRLLGTPSDEDTEFIANPHAKKFLKSREFRTKTPLADFIGGSHNPLAIDLLEKMLVFNPRKRITVKEALRHPYLSDLHDSDEETECREELDFRFEHGDHSFAEMKQMLLEEIEKDQEN